MATRPEITGRKTGRRLLDYRALKERGIPWTRVHIGRLEAAKKFPLHIDVGENSVAWFEDEIDDYLEIKAAERDAKAACANQPGALKARDERAGPARQFPADSTRSDGNETRSPKPPRNENTRL
jgi:prophage regulatory protein